ncbi:MAG: hypothetical protein GWP70_05920 [Proteobacteria bacterium]|nr:hypothetical protein [Pseudomonadota bacterium]
MADEEKPTQDAEEADLAPSSAVDTQASDGEMTGASAADVMDSSSADEAIEAITKNVQERAAEIEDVLADASTPIALPKGKPESPAPVFDAVADATAATEDNEPNLQISVGGEKVRISTAHPLIEDIAEQLQKSRQFTMYSVGGLCSALLAAVLLYVLMAAQLSSKVGEIDAMLGAMAKRTLQMTKGIESFSALETRLQESLANQLMLREMLAANEIAMMGLNEEFDAMPAEIGGATNSTVSAAQQALDAQLQSLQTQSASLSGSLAGLRQSVDAQEAELSALRSVRRELSTLRSSMQTVEKTVADLYIIERARVAKQMLGAKAEVIGE